ncbi:hypothetical protein MAR_009756, partial [Mya arenaria]
MSLGKASSEIDQLQKQNDQLKDSMNYITSQSMRNNLVFSNIAEGHNEKPFQTEDILRGFMRQEMDISSETVQNFKFERVHRTGQPNRGGKRNIVAKFSFFKDRECVRRSRDALKGSSFFVNEQFPKDVVDRRKSLMPKLRASIDNGKRAWISYDTLYVDGVPIRDGAGLRMESHGDVNRGRGGAGRSENGNVRSGSVGAGRDVNGDPNQGRVGTGDRSIGSASVVLNRHDTILWMKLDKLFF